MRIPGIQGILGVKRDPGYLGIPEKLGILEPGDLSKMSLEVRSNRLILLVAVLD